MESRNKKSSFVSNFKFSGNLDFIQVNKIWYIHSTKERGSGSYIARLELIKRRVGLSTLAPLEVEFVDEILKFMKAWEKEKNE